MDYLYHYTSIESLALILKNRTIRLNPLDKMDDLQEQKTADVENLGKFVFVSSWTDDETESIPMWQMYTNPSAGVRIKMRKNPFAWHTTTGENLSKILGTTLNEDGTSKDGVRTFLDLAEMMSGGYFSPQAWGGKILEKVIYTDDLSILEPTVLSIVGDKKELKVGSLGKHKSTYWSFQNEWRYIMTFMTGDFSHGVEGIIQSFTINANAMAMGTAMPPFRYYDLLIDEIAFNEMEIMCSPQITAGNRVLLETLVEKYNPNAKIEDSALLGKL